VCVCVRRTINSVDHSSSSNTAAETCNVTPMTHAPETGDKSTTFLRRRFLVRVSCISDTRFICYQILTSIRTLFYSRPESGVHTTEMTMTYHWSMITVYLSMCFLVVILSQITNLSSTSLSAMFIFGARNFHSSRIMVY